LIEQQGATVISVPRFRVPRRRRMSAHSNHENPAKHGLHTLSSTSDEKYSLLHAIVLAPLFGERKKKKKVL
jgi:hypothetical protein